MREIYTKGWKLIKQTNGETTAVDCIARVVYKKRYGPFLNLQKTWKNNQ